MLASLSYHSDQEVHKACTNLELHAHIAGIMGGPRFLGQEAELQVGQSCCRSQGAPCGRALLCAGDAQPQLQVVQLPSTHQQPLQVRHACAGHVCQRQRAQPRAAAGSQKDCHWR
jgi:hypothetical protein